ncbi:MAG TPA: (deoxy)nucleoside triphosphate pyrophosphohydrolase, partial [Planctomycetota bacterium]|nr:(deoxy)nucleoside triphosphate pyrophosphohydrolase [Planctomycetota bacterium]
AMRRHEVAAGILWDGERVLIAKRHEDDHQGGRWEFPGGKRRGHESIEECLKREMLEEIGVEVDVGRLWRALTHVYPDRTVTLYFHLCESRSGTPRPIECAEVRWVSPGALRELRFVEGDIQVLPDLVRDLTARAV